MSQIANSRYELLERTGEGPLFQVFKVRDRSAGRVVALKTLQTPFTYDPALAEALRECAPPLTELTHPGIARVFELAEEENQPLLIMEYVRGINLKERIRRIAPFTQSVAVDFAIAIGEALQYAHARGVLHGDLRPQNVIVTPEGAVKVTDFGLAPVLDAHAEVRQRVRQRGAPYEAPEVTRTGQRTVSGDIYALGAILFEMLTGSTPYSGENPDAVAARAAEGNAPSVRSLNPGVPRALDAIARKALSKDPAARYRSVSELLADLKAVRDALRFGKPLNWTPDSAEEASQAAAPAPVPAPTAVQTYPPPAAPPAAPVERPSMRTTVAADDRISPYLKFALYTVILIIICSVVAGVAVWMSTFAKPPDTPFPNLVGMKIEQARAAAEKAQVRLIEHEAFHEKEEAGVIFRTDLPAGRPARPGRSINVWVSKGSRMAWVPQVVNLPKQEAEEKIKAAGLNLGEVDLKHHATIPQDSVIAQNPKGGKRVSRDVLVNLVISDGPKPLPEPEPGAVYVDPNRSGDPFAAPSVPQPDMEPRSYRLQVVIKRDGRGKRRVRVEYDDLRGTHPTVDEEHDEGDVVEQRVEVYGPAITIRVYYDDDVVPIVEQTRPVAGGR